MNLSRWVQKIHTNGSGEQSCWSSREEEVELVLPALSLRILNSTAIQEVLQWVAYYASK